jgi:hypothetical protein
MYDSITQKLNSNFVCHEFKILELLTTFLIFKYSNHAHQDTKYCVKNHKFISKKEAIDI